MIFGLKEEGTQGEGESSSVLPELKVKEGMVGSPIIFNFSLL